MLISDIGQVYVFGKDSFGDSAYGIEGSSTATTPQLVESLKGIFAVQAVIGNFFTAVLSREGRVYTFSWGSDAILGHQTDLHDQEPHLLKGDLEDVPVVQIATGYCYLLAVSPVECKFCNLNIFYVPIDFMKLLDSCVAEPSLNLKITLHAYMWVSAGQYILLAVA